MSVSEFPIPSEDQERRETEGETEGETPCESHGERVDEDKWSPRLRLLTVVFSSLVLWSGIFLVASWIF